MYILNLLKSSGCAIPFQMMVRRCLQILRDTLDTDIPNMLSMTTMSASHKPQAPSGS